MSVPSCRQRHSFPKKEITNGALHLKNKILYRSRGEKLLTENGEVGTEQGSEPKYMLPSLTIYVSKVYPLLLQSFHYIFNGRNELIIYLLYGLLAYEIMQTCIHTSNLLICYTLL